MCRECELCGKNMDIFVSKDENVIFMCPCCGSIYLPNRTRNKRVVDYICNYSGTFTPIGDMPTMKQASYLKYLASQLNLKIDIYSLTKSEVFDLISKLKEEVDNKTTT